MFLTCILGTLNEEDLESLGVCSPLLPTFLPSPDTTTMLSTEDCDQVLSVIDCPTPFSETDSLVQENSTLTEVIQLKFFCGLLGSCGVGQYLDIQIGQGD